MVHISLKVPEELNNRVRLMAERRSTSTSDVVRQALEQYLSSNPDPSEGSFLDLTRDILGVFRGPGDLSTNKKYMKGYGR